MHRLDFHADDYGVSINNSKRIIELIRSGRADSISFIPNMGCFDECMALLKDNWDGFEKKPLISIHLNLIDGYKLSSKNSDEIQNNTWFDHFIRSLIPGSKKKALREYFISEISLQIKTVYDQICTLKDNDNNPVALRIDSHVHTHSIPLVFDSLIKALKNLDLLDKTQYIRNPREPFLMFFTTKGVISRVPFINIIKNIILNVLGIPVKIKLNRLGISSGIMWGLMMSGNMDVDRVNALLPKMNSLAAKKDLHLEILCHPGIVLEEEKRPEYGKDDMIAFFSKNRDVEYDMLMDHISV